MKRFIFFLLSIMTFSMSMLAASNARCLLQHKGTGKIYNADAIETAIKDAVDGDTIFLTEGQFPGFTINKKITVRGAGQGTKITGDMKVSISGTPTLKQAVLEGFNAEGKTISLTTPMNGVKIKQGLFGGLSVDANNDDAIVDRCNISSELISSRYIKGLNVISSEVTIGSSSMSTDASINFVNCYVTAYYVNKCAGTFLNCIVNGQYYRNSMRYYNCNFINTLLCGNYRQCDYSSTLQDCYESTETTFDVNTLENLGFFGNDGTVVGPFGGAYPYTLELAVPKIVENKVSLDAEKKVLNVTLKVSAN